MQPLCSILVALSQLLFLLVQSENFMPTIKTRCINGFMSILVETADPFYGVAYGRNHRDECFVRGVGSLSTTINVPLTALKACGVVYDQTIEQYSLLLDVRQHHMIILQQDRTFNVSCPKPTGNQIDDRQETVSTISMGIFEADGNKAYQTVFGDNYTIKLSGDQDFMVTSCMGFAGYNYSLELTDYNGCTRDSELMSNFIYDSKTKTTMATLKSMFKFPQYSTVHIQCAVSLCPNGYCSRVDCNRRRDDPLPLESERIVQESFASTTVQVIDIGNRTKVVYEESCDYHYNVLIALCILFGMLFLGSACINIAFCSVIGCCTTDRVEETDYVVKDPRLMPPSTAIPAGRHVPLWSAYPAIWYPPSYFPQQEATNHSPVSYKSAASSSSTSRLLNRRPKYPAPSPPQHPIFLR